MKHFIHSLSTLPMKINCFHLTVRERTVGNIWYYATSLAYLHKFNQEVYLHTDSIGAQFLEGLPYDKVILSCDKMDKSIHPRFWAAAKFYALKNDDINAVHIDGDVFIRDMKIIDRIQNEDYDVIVQSYEPGDTIFYLSTDGLFQPHKQELIDLFGMDFERRGAYNTGTISFNNPELRTKFIDDYFKIAQYLTQHESDAMDKEAMVAPDLIVEQERLRQLCIDNNYKVSCIFEGDNVHPQIKTEEYQHLCSTTKYAMIKRTKELLYKLDPKLHQQCQQLEDKFKTGWRDILKTENYYHYY